MPTTTQYNPLMSPYAPVRYRVNAWWMYAREVAEARRVTSQGLIHPELPSDIETNLMMPYMRGWAEHIKEFPELGDATGLMATKLLLLRHWVPLAAQFEACGRQIYDLADGLVDMLNHTDVAECTLEDWNPPYDAFFLRFGKQSDINLPFEDEESQFEYLDGAFIGVSPVDVPYAGRRVRFGLTTVRENGKGMGLPGYFLDFYPDMLKLPIPQAIDAALAHRVQEIRSASGESETSKNLAEHQCAFFEESADLLRRSVSLIVNAMFYIESLGPVTKREPGRDAPSELIQRWAQSNERQRQKLASKLTSEGFAVVRLIGTEITTGAHPTGLHGSVRTHWRRGHWRQQRHGPQLSLRKRTWIKPVMVNAAQPHDDLPGHVYVVPSVDGDMVH